MSTWSPPAPCKTCGGRRTIGGNSCFNYDQPVACPDCLGVMPRDHRGVVVDPTICGNYSPVTKEIVGRRRCYLPPGHKGLVHQSRGGQYEWVGHSFRFRGHSEWIGRTTPSREVEL